VDGSPQNSVTAVPVDRATAIPLRKWCPRSCDCDCGCSCSCGRGYGRVTINRSRHRAPLLAPHPSPFTLSLSKRRTARRPTPFTPC